MRTSRRIAAVGIAAFAVVGAIAFTGTAQAAAPVECGNTGQHGGTSEGQGHRRLRTRRPPSPLRCDPHQRRNRLSRTA